MVLERRVGGLPGRGPGPDIPRSAFKTQEPRTQAGISQGKFDLALSIVQNEDYRRQYNVTNPYKAAIQLVRSMDVNQLENLATQYATGRRTAQFTFEGIRGALGRVAQTLRGAPPQPPEAEPRRVTDVQRAQAPTAQALAAQLPAAQPPPGMQPGAAQPIIPQGVPPAQQAVPPVQPLAPTAPTFAFGPGPPSPMVGPGGEQPIQPPVQPAAPMAPVQPQVPQPPVPAATLNEWASQIMQGTISVDQVPEWILSRLLAAGLITQNQIDQLRGRQPRMLPQFEFR